MIVVTLLNIDTELGRLVIDLLTENELFTQAVEGVMRRLGHPAENIDNHAGGKFIVLYADSGQSLDVLTGKGDILLRIGRDNKGSKTALDAVSDLEGVGREFVHSELEGDGTTPLMFRKFA